MKEACHRRDSISAFVSKKLGCKTISITAIRYGRESNTNSHLISSTRELMGVIMVSVQPCGLYVDPRLAASPDGIVMLHNLLTSRKDV